MNEKSETFIVYVASFNLVPGIYPDRETQITFLLTKEVKIPDKYLYFTNVFLEEKTLVLPERTKLNEHAINLEDGKQPPYKLIYNLGLVKLKTLKIYIETHLKTGFIWSSKSLASTLIFYDKKPDDSLSLCVDY